VEVVWLGGPFVPDEMRTLPILRHLNSDKKNTGLDQSLPYARTTAARLGITPQSLNTSLYSSFGQSPVSIIYMPLNQYYVVLEVAPQFSQSPDGLNAIYPSTSSRGATPLDTVVLSRPGTTPLAVNHTGLFPSVTISFNLAQGVSLSDATRDITDLHDTLGMPSTVLGFFSGTLLAFQQSLASEPILVLTALMAVYIVL